MSEWLFSPISRLIVLLSIGCLTSNVVQPSSVYRLTSNHAGRSVLVHAKGLKPLSPIFTKNSPCLRSLYSPCFAEGQSTSDHQFSASLLRTFSHHVLVHAKRLEVASPYSSSTRSWCTRCRWDAETFALLATTYISLASQRPFFALLKRATARKAT